MKPYRGILVLTLEVLLISGHLLQAQSPLSPTNPELEKFMIFVRDAADSALIKDVEVNPRSYTLDGKERAGGAIGHTSDGMIRVGLGEGKHELVFQAKGYHPLMIKDCFVRSTKHGGNMIAVGLYDLAYIGDTFTYTVYLERARGQTPHWRFRNFLSDTIYYHMPQVLPQLVGGEQSLKRQLTPTTLKGHPNGGKSVSSVSSTVFIEKDGSVGKVEVFGDGPTSMHRVVEQAIRRVRFTPAMILGNPVRSMVFVPFEFALDWEEK
jgi:hypothetical protein